MDVIDERALVYAALLVVCSTLAVFTGPFVAAITFVSIFFFDQKIDNAGLVGIALIVAGVMVLRLFSESSVDG